jgi:hypothetical protein
MYDIPLSPLTFDLLTNFDVTPSDVSTALMNVSQTAPGLDNFPYKLLYFLHLNYPSKFSIYSPKMEICERNTFKEAKDGY